MSDDILTEEEKQMLDDPGISDEEKYEMIDAAIWRAAIG